MHTPCDSARRTAFPTPSSSLPPPGGPPGTTRLCLTPRRWTCASLPRPRRRSQPPAQPQSTPEREESAQACVCGNARVVFSAYECEREYAPEKWRKRCRRGVRSSERGGREGERE
eukprot:970080-Pleurochrysis_carterae.AAC.1